MPKAAESQIWKHVTHFSHLAHWFENHSLGYLANKGSVRGSDPPGWGGGQGQKIKWSLEPREHSPKIF